LGEKDLIDKYELELCDPACLPGAPIWAAKAHLTDDVSEVMPYLNAVLERTFYSGNKQWIIWREDARKYALRPHELAVSGVVERGEGKELIDEAVEMINDVWRRMAEITPDETASNPPQVIDILKNLPRTNCGECGLPSCMAFAAALVEGDRSLEGCPYLLKEENSAPLERLRELGL
jgi:ArsR family metal-binding transcriptional regulator